MSLVYAWWLFVVACVYNTNALLKKWTLPNSILPQADFSMAVGYYNGSIFMIGGYNHPQQLTVFNTNTDSFTDFGTNAFNGSVEGTTTIYGQFSTQNGRFIFTINRQPPHLFGVFDMTTKQYTNKWINISHIRNSSNYECLASSTNYLFAVASKQIQMLDLITLQWMQYLPTMNDYKFNFVCLVHKDKLLVFGRGSGHGSVIDGNITNEAIIITDIAQNSWQYFTSQPVDYPGPAIYDKAVAHQNKIYLTTGDYFYVYVYDTAADNWTEPLSWERIFSPALIVADNILYAFGGDQYAYGDQGYLEFITLNTWRYYQLLTFPIVNASTQTSTSPTGYLTGNPTTDPSLSPSESTTEPSGSPTKQPSASPTKEASGLPTKTFSTANASTTIGKSSIAPNDGVENGSENINIWLMLGVAAGCVCLTMFVGISIGIWWQRKQQRDQHQSSQNMIQQPAAAKAENIQKNDDNAVGKDVVDYPGKNQRQSVSGQEDEEGLQMTQEGQKEPEPEASQMTSKSAVVSTCTTGYTRSDSADV
eukprot:703918_1